MKRFYFPLSSLVDEIDLFTGASKRRNYSLKKEENNFRFELEIPGFSKDDVIVNIEDELLNIKCKKENSEKSFSYDLGYIVENNNIELSKTTATVENGILSLEIPIIQDKKKPKQIEVKIK